jgi:excisionase family DNA binding protein
LGNGPQAHEEGGLETMETRSDQLLTLPEVAVRLGVCVATVRRMIDRDGLPARRVGRQFRVPTVAFENWCETLDIKSKSTTP